MRVLVIAHRTELITQAVGHAKRAGLTAGIEMGAQICPKRTDVVVSTVQTLNSTRRCDWCNGVGGDCGKCKGSERSNRRDRERTAQLVMIGVLLAKGELDVQPQDCCDDDIGALMEWCQDKRTYSADIRQWVADMSGLSVVEAASVEKWTTPTLNACLRAIEKQRNESILDA